MAKPRLNQQNPQKSDLGRRYPWLASYPPGINWDTHFEPFLISLLLDRAVAEHARRSCIYFKGKRYSYAEIGRLSDRAAKGLQALGV
jgi:long-chain acyl-CoA synthetase